MNKPAWHNAGHLLDYFDGGETEIHVIGLPIAQLRKVIDTLRNLPALKVSDFMQQGSYREDLDDFNFTELVEPFPETSFQLDLCSAQGTPQQLQAYLWVDTESKRLELYSVFWND